MDTSPTAIAIRAVIEEGRNRERARITLALEARAKPGYRHSPYEEGYNDALDIAGQIVRDELPVERTP
jgi:hypothetical protein